MDTLKDIVLAMQCTTIHLQPLTAFLKKAEPSGDYYMPQNILEKVQNGECQRQFKAS